MYYEPELQMLQSAFRKCRIQTSILNFSLPISNHIELHLYSYLHKQLPGDLSLRELLPPVNEATIYRFTDPFTCRYIYIPLPETGWDAVLLIGPYIHAIPTTQQRLELAEKAHIPPAVQQDLEQFYRGIPILQETSHLFALLEVFGEKLWGVNGFTVEDISHQTLAIESAVTTQDPPPSEEALVWNMRNMEQRYSYENELMDAVSKGQVHRADLLLGNFSVFSFEQRLSDPVRNGKNYCIIMNTLLRKAAERGGVHPVYLDSISSDFAHRIEQLDSTDALLPLMQQMFRGYCLLVRNHATKDYSPPVQKAIACIDADLSGNLNLRSLSAALNISSSYLSTIFKKETGSTLTDFIINRRINHARHLLENTRLQIQTIAQHCGIVDVHYFSKTFKRITGKTPKAYRESLRK